MIMSKKETLSAATEIMWGNHPVSDYRNFLYQAVGKDIIDSKPDFYKWIYHHTGKTIGEVADDIHRGYAPTTMTELLAERRCEHISETDKAFIVAFDKAMNDAGYDCENIISSGLTWSQMMIIYGKTGTKSRPIAARLYIHADGEIYFRFFLNKVDKHIAYIENAPSHVKNAFKFEGGDCTSCNVHCKHGKVYTIDRQQMQKCSHNTFPFYHTATDALPDYMELFARFYPLKHGK